MERLRVGLFTEIYHPVVNGVVASVEALAHGLQSAGHEVFCFAPQMPGASEGDDGVVRIPSLPLPARAPYRLTLPLVSRREARAVIKSLSIVHVHSPFVTGWMGATYARRYGMPLVYTYHTQLEAYAHYVPFEQGATRYAASRLTRTFANLAAGVIAPTPAMAARLRELGVTARIETIPSGIDVALFGSGRRTDAARARAGAGPADTLLLSVGRLAREKNIELLFPALAQAGDPSLRLAIAGDGPIRAELERAAAEHGVAGRVRFLGGVPRNELPDLYAAADAFVMPSLTETQGLVAAEALAAGALVIAADAPQNRDVVGTAGLLVPPTAEAFAHAFTQAGRPRDPAAAELAQQSAQRFSIANQVAATLLLYHALVGHDALDCEHTFA